ncbi:MAG: NfeD family protein [Lachnospiraceae bacterium]|nr:NfeD family protein [Lachnospiraceae bacterium]
MEYGWLMAFIVLIVIEVFTVGLTTIWFALGSLVAYFAHLLGAGTWVQMVLFIIISVVSMILIRPIAIRTLKNKNVKTNVDAIAGKKVKVLKTINNIEAAGEVLIDGIEWTARTEDDTVIEKDEIVEVVRIEGVKAIVKKVE